MYYGNSYIIFLNTFGNVLDGYIHSPFWNLRFAQEEKQKADNSSCKSC